MACEIKGEEPGEQAIADAAQSGKAQPGAMAAKVSVGKTGGPVEESPGAPVPFGADVARGGDAYLLQCQSAGNGGGFAEGGIVVRPTNQGGQCEYDKELELAVGAVLFDAASPAGPLRADCGREHIDGP